uniref:Chemokine interleukin-8-like domain-containing protein n=1 Tax=Sinocyclocheilus grahami TaxID=75366 RepID=A0A672K3F6_SINGR
STVNMETRRILMRSLAVAMVMASVIWTTTVEVIDPIIDIQLQHESFPCVKTFIFKTKQGKFCSDSRQLWVQEKVKQIL